MKRMGRSVPPHLMSRFKESLKTEPLEKLPRPCYVVDEILPPKLVTKIDEKIQKQKEIRTIATKRPRANIGFRKVARKAVHENIITAEGIMEISLRSDEDRKKKKSKERVYK